MVVLYRIKKLFLMYEVKLYFNMKFKKYVRHGSRHVAPTARKGNSPTLAGMNVVSSILTA